MSAVFTAKQEEAIRALKHDELARLNIFEGSVRSGKTHISLIMWALWIATMPDTYDYLMTGRTITTLRRNGLEPMIAILGTGAFRYSTAA